MIVKKATKNEYDIFYGFVKKLDQYHRNSHPEIVKPTTKISRSKKWFEDIIKDKKQFLLFGYENNNPIGFIHFEIVSPKSHPVIRTQKHIHLHDIFIDRKYRGKKYGKNIFDEMLNIAKKNRINQIWLNVWFFNQDAISFYSKLGFKTFSMKMRLSLK
jgi:diamine N-acetyltransferase